MEYDNTYIAEKLRRWEKYLREYRLPAWEAIPDFGLYMEQVMALLTGYLDYLPPELKRSASLRRLPSTITSATSLCRSPSKRSITAYTSPILS